MTTSDSPLASHPPPDPTVFATWLRSRGVVQHPSIEIKLATDGSGYGVWSTDDIARGEILCAIPRQSILSARTTSLQRPYEPESAADIILHLTACLLHELRLGEESDWYGWLQMIPRDTVLLPTLWSEESVGGEDGRRALEWLAGTEAQKQLERKDREGLSLEALRQYHFTLELPPTTHHSDQSLFSTFLYAYSMVSSRGFALDSYHLIGLIPFCDMFNHSSSSPHTSLSIDANVCEHCGSLLQCEHDAPDFERLEGLSARYLAKLEADGMADMVDMRVQRDVEKGKQVFSCYDEDHGDAELLVEYGFIEGGNTTITWTHRELLELDPQAARDFMALSAREPESSDSPGIGNDEGCGPVIPFVGPPCPLDQQPEPVVIRSNGEVSRSLIAILITHIHGDEKTIEVKGHLYDKVIRSLTYLRREDMGPSTSSIARRVCGLVSERMQELRGSELDKAHLEMIMEALHGDEYRLEHMALQNMICERRHLQDCYDRWRPFPTIVAARLGRHEANLV